MLHLELVFAQQMDRAVLKWERELLLVRLEVLSKPSPGFLAFEDA